MMKRTATPKIPEHPYPELRGVLNTFTKEISTALKENLVGIYLVGSLASGDFDLDSDVDFMVVTDTELTEDAMKPLEDIQKRIQKIDRYPAKHLEGSFISINDLNDRETVGKKKLLYFDNGSTECEWSTHDNQWHVRWVLRECSIPIIGPTPQTFMREIPIEEMIAEIKASMLEGKEIFAAEIDRPLCFSNSRFGQSFFVLTYCRMLQSIHTGTVQSKKAGAEWAKGFADLKWRGLIDQAWKEREGVRFMEKIRQRAEQEHLYETLEFINYAVSQMENTQVSERNEYSDRGKASSL